MSMLSILRKSLWNTFKTPGTDREIMVFTVKKLRSLNRLHKSWIRQILQILLWWFYTKKLMYYVSETCIFPFSMYDAIIAWPIIFIKKLLPLSSCGGIATWMVSPSTSSLIYFLILYSILWTTVTSNMSCTYMSVRLSLPYQSLWYLLRVLEFKLQSDMPQLKWQINHSIGNNGLLSTKSQLKGLVGDLYNEHRQR
jgi:hypothetical protein